MKRIKNVREERINIKEVVEFINQHGAETEVLIGSDSDTYRYNDERWILFTVLIGVHIDGCKGVKLFKHIEWERDKSGSMRKRLLNEVGKLIEIAGVLMDIIDIEPEVHLDINSKPNHASNSVMSQATGWVKGVLGVEPKVKPHAFFASNAADHFTKI